MTITYIGILLNASVYQSIRSGSILHEKLAYYEEIGREVYLKPCYFRLQDMKLSRSHMLVYIYTEQGYIRKRIRMPHIIHNRAIYRSMYAKHKLERFSKRGHLIFNGWNRYKKSYIQKLLLQDASIRAHLPETMTATPRSIAAMMEKHDAIMVKPDKGSLGLGIMQILRRDGFYELSYPPGRKLHAYPFGKEWVTLYFQNKLPRPLLQAIRNKDYIVQQKLPLANYKGRPFDLRVSVQRDGTGQWQVTGIAGKVAPLNSFLTNVAQGGEVYPLADLLREYPILEVHHVEAELHQFALLIANILSNHLPRLADIGLDIGLTEHGFPLFIECNSKDLRYSFREAGMMEEWKAAYRSPMAYARYLLDLETSITHD
jgi:hypothetical protein